MITQTPRESICRFHSKGGGLHNSDNTGIGHSPSKVDPSWSHRSRSESRVALSGLVVVAFGWFWPLWLCSHVRLTFSPAGAPDRGVDQFMSSAIPRNSPYLRVTLGHFKPFQPQISHILGDFQGPTRYILSICLFWRENFLLAFFLSLKVGWNNLYTCAARDWMNSSNLDHLLGCYKWT